MQEHHEPTINNWFRNREENRIFKVVATDEDSATIEIQYFESDIEELDFDTWNELHLESVAEPEDWSGPFDDLLADDMGDTDSPQHPENWSDPLDDIE